MEREAGRPGRSNPLGRRERAGLARRGRAALHRRGSAGRTVLLAALAVLASASCATWRPVATFEGWTLYSEGGRKVEPEAYRQAFAPARAAVENVLGPFQRTIRVYAWDGTSGGPGSGREQLFEGEGGPIQDVPGIGPARVRAFHARGDGLLGSPSGVYLGSTETGTAVHELVHARVAEECLELPLWLEEGLACYLGDGIVDRGTWVVDGLACWPLRELSEQRLDDADLERLLALRAERTASVRDNVLAHFVGWAIVFDLVRESREHGPAGGTGAHGFDWRAWCERYCGGMPPAEARARLARTIDERTALDWMARLSGGERGTRLAAAKGVWKLRSLPVLEALIDALEKEEDPEVRIGLAINALAAAGEMKTPQTLTRRLWRTVWPALRRAKLPDATEQAAIEKLLRSFRFGRNESAQEPLQTLARFWAE